MADSPYPELKKTHTMARMGRPWTDVKPPPLAPVWNVIFGLGAYWMLVAAIEVGLFEALSAHGPLDPGELAGHLEASLDTEQSFTPGHFAQTGFAGRQYDQSSPAQRQIGDLVRRHDAVIGCVAR